MDGALHARRLGDTPFDVGSGRMNGSVDDVGVVVDVVFVVVHAEHGSDAGDVGAISMARKRRLVFRL